MRQIFTPSCVGWHVPALHSASESQSWMTGPLAPAGGAHEVWQLDVDWLPPPPTSRQQTLPAPQLAAFTHASAALPSHEPAATHASVAPPPPPPDTQHSWAPAAHFAAPHAKVAPPGGVDVGAPVGVDVGAPVVDPVAIDGGVVVEPPLAGSAPTEGLAGSVGLVVVEEPPMTLPSVEPPQATAARTPASDAAKRTLRGSEVFIGGTSG